MGIGKTQQWGHYNIRSLLASWASAYMGSRSVGCTYILEEWTLGGYTHPHTYTHTAFHFRHKVPLHSIQSLLWLAFVYLSQHTQPAPQWAMWNFILHSSTLELCFSGSIWEPLHGPSSVHWCLQPFWSILGALPTPSHYSSFSCLAFLLKSQPIPFHLFFPLSWLELKAQLHLLLGEWEWRTATLHSGLRLHVYGLQTFPAAKDNCFSRETLEYDYTQSLFYPF